MARFAAILSDGDLEVVLLHETHSVLADIIGPNLYTIYGTEPEQDVVFKSEEHFNLFLILAVELIAEGARSSLIDDRYQNWSLLGGLRWLCNIHDTETKGCNLDNRLRELETWTRSEERVTCWCSDVDRYVTLAVSRHDLISFGANTAKHHLIRLSSMLEKLHKISVASGYSFTAQDIVAILPAVTEEIRHRLRYYATILLEMFGKVFESLNALVDRRFRANPTNSVDQMIMPAGVTSDVFRNLYGDVLVFKRYTPERIRDFTPTAMAVFRKPYR